ncbi:FkbM family methyltransferase [Cyanobacteria bacterium FACHB-63]|nr:FkbM family methyltransferase [Cyanobacteria bacterium FACHB-63]
MVSVINNQSYVHPTSLFDRLKQRLSLEYKMVCQEVIDLRGIKIRIKNLSKLVCKALCYGFYEFEEISLLQRYLSTSDTVMEIGAGIGFLSSYCAKSIGSSRVFAYEANPLLRSHIEDTYRLNAVNPNVEFCILSQSEGTTTFYVEKDFWISSTIPHTSQAQAIQVPMKSLNQEIQRINPTFLILDIEGGEYDLLQFIDFHTIEKVLIEIHEPILGTEKVNFVREQLNNAGFELSESFTTTDVSLWKRCR